MKYLLIVDLQKEFVKDREGRKVYDKCIKFINTYRQWYDRIITEVYVNGGNINMQRLVNYNQVYDPKLLEFEFTDPLIHSGYTNEKLLEGLMPSDQVDIIGFDTDACVLAAAFRLFDHNVNLRLLVDGIWSSGGKKMHEAGLACMKRQFAKAVITTDLMRYGKSLER